MYYEGYVFAIGLGFGVGLNMDCFPSSFRVYDQELHPLIINRKL